MDLRETLVRLDLKDQPDKEANLDHLELKEKGDLLVLQAYLDHLVPLDHLELPENRDHQDHRDKEDQVDQLVRLVTREMLA